MLLKFFYYFSNESSVDVYMHTAPFRWKQYDAYVQVLEAKYADLCCKSNNYTSFFKFFFYQCAEAFHAHWTILNCL